MYVIFPAEEVVYFTYGYRRILSAVPNQVPSTTSPNTTTTPPSNLPVNIYNNHINNYNNNNLILNNNNNKNLTEQQQQTTSTSSLRQKKISNASNIIINANTSESCSSNSGKLQDDSKNGNTPKRPSRKKQKVALSVTNSGTVTPTKSKSKEHTPDIEDFFERAKNRPRVNTFDNLKVPDQQYHTSSTLPLNLKKFQAKSAPSTPIAARKSPLYRSFETERQHISTITLNLDRSTSDTSNKTKRKKESQVSKETPSTSRGRTPDFDFLFLDPEEQRIRRSPSANRFDQSTPEKSPTKKKTFFLSLPTRTKHNKSGNLQQDITTDNFLIGGGYNMAATQHGGLNNESCLRELTHSSFNEPLKAQNAVTFKLVKTVSDFTQHLSQIYEQNAEQLQLLVENFRKRNGELRKERPACPSSLFHTWETLLQEVEIDSQNHSDIASILSRQVSRPLLERSFHRKIQSRKVFTHRESFETIISKTEEKLSKCRQEYKTAYLSYLSEPSQKSLSSYFNTHNAYVQQLHATNGMLDEYSKTTLPNLLQELEEIYSDLCSSVAESILQGAEVISQRATDQTRRYDSLSSQCRAVSGPTDLIQFARALPTPAHNKPVLRRLFNPPQPPHNDSTPGDGTNTATSGTSDGTGQYDHFNEINIPPPLKNELVIDRLASVQIKPSLDALRKEQQDLDTQIKQIQDSLDALIRMQQRSLESQLFNKVNELEEDISAKRFDLHVAQIHLRAIQFQKELFTSKADAGDSSRERKMSSTSQGSMKSKWLKAFKSLKTPPSSANTSPRESEKEKKNGGGMRNMGESEAHTFQEYTYKKITPCDVCSQVLRGHTRQGLKCRVCKMNVHVDCQEKATRCQSKSRLLRRQKSTSEIDTRFNEAAVEEETSEFEGEDNYFTYPKVNRQLSFKDTHSRVTYIPTELESPEVDLIYQVLKQATDLSNNSKPNRSSPYDQQQQQEAQRSQVPERTSGINGPISGAGSSGSSSGQSLHKFRSIAGAALNVQQRSITASSSTTSNLTVSNPAPHSTSSDTKPISGSTSTSDGSMRRRLFAGMKSLTGFGSRSRHGSPNSRSISLPESSGYPRFNMRTSTSTQFLNTPSTNLDSPTTGAPHSPRRQKLNLRMKSLSLDSPESTEHVQRRRHGGGTSAGVASATSGTTIDQSNSSSSRIQSPSSPVHNRRLLSARNMRMSSVELPDDNEKSLSSASTSPCPSPVSGAKKAHRLLPTNLYVILYNYKSRQADELDLKAGYKVTVIDTSDNDWWKGKCLGKVGYFPSKYCTRLVAGEKPLQVTQNLRIAGGDNNEGLLLLRDQIVIQIAEELDGMIMVRNGNNQTGCCPTMFLQEV